eukprot:COSAG02_NODE_2254_length_9348_cov_2.773273_7_plen_118_part_00
MVSHADCLVSSGIPKKLEGDIMTGIQNIKETLGTEKPEHEGEETPPARHGQASSKRQKLGHAAAKKGDASQHAAETFDDGCSTSDEILEWCMFTPDTTALVNDHENDFESDTCESDR